MIDAAAFVHPKWNPKLADGAAVIAGCREDAHFLSTDAATTLTCIVPNVRGMHGAIAAGVQDISIWLTGTEAFSERNLNMSIEEHIEVNRGLVALAQQYGARFPTEIHTRGSHWIPRMFA